MKRILSINIGKKGFAEEYLEACREFGVDTEVVRSRNIVMVLKDGQATLYHSGQAMDVNTFDYAFIRVTGRYTLMTSLLAQFLQHARVPLNEEIYLQHTQNEEKITQMLQLTFASVPIPQTILFTLDGYTENAKIIAEHISFPAVLKTNGSKGQNVWKVESEEDLAQRVQTLAEKYETALIQEYIPNTYDIRALYVYGSVIGAIKRAATDGFYNNVSHGGTTASLELTAEEDALARRACEVLQRNFGGVDIVRTERGPYIFEVNLGPQIYGFEGATGINVPREIIRRLAQN